MTRHPARGRIGRRSPATEPEPGEEMLTVEDLVVEFGDGPTATRALRGVDLSLRAGQVLGVAGESGSGKTTAALATMGLLARGARTSGSIRYRGTELLSLPERELRQYRGSQLAMIFQETASALNPVFTVGDQLMMAARAHTPGGRGEVRRRVEAALADVRLLDTDRVMNSYPHELSGGMCQRAIIAMALSCGSRVLFADEPTTALDVSVQREILDLIRGLVDRHRLAVMMISHDLAVLSDVCDDLMVMYRGRVVESGDARTVLSAPGHPYTQALLDCIPTLHGTGGDLREITPEQRVIIENAAPVGVAAHGGARR
ncbi:ABC transporter ATP-binding protein [Aeromicrobium sp. YIM 150415]|uniref:ABC transporter ATP-binding protein n=1 Tax=Aeromicrobium sp. YIM 150415 TaxID=2803912 RepID=UPI001966575C|nr:ABC transporter ATP-binding protein [Aeromicrobium sp. YIM 150415]MBM9463993.1 ABC transporter ATP-binding protein [Aeromicrobium sp. YIM 150415]